MKRFRKTWSSSSSMIRESAPARLESPSRMGSVRAWHRRRPDGERNQRGGGAEGRAGDAVVPAPGSVFALDARQPGADRFAPLRPVVATGFCKGLGAQHVRDVLLTAVAAKAADERLIRKTLARGNCGGCAQFSRPRGRPQRTRRLVQSHACAVLRSELL